ncbi:hypothetical protein ACU5P1_16710 [Pseudomonas plecoglossicida]|uniref:HphA C-terminal domain-containing protein n=1 Tax=Pseudomonas plecoglossicida TaxID=70775 RepID=A0AAD0VSN1_PSEDL|nr:hypothetical protein [Pseudomonas plecoglossicida]AXM95563.1 hypothetical protein DVB73_06990 [Pseudomonas plecoglossicida]EPB94369.1 hypothetical protein L321_18527 [Pseudomonas plecoglossicida NB2011]QLB56311.1 hypothetical protein HAV28_16535 [Pseudomonas plecoglossicida]GLR37924.1 hypothetical protein GCM10011247_33220 [Pseudomonas plecoglossicida]
MTALRTPLLAIALFNLATTAIAADIPFHKLAVIHNLANRDYNGFAYGTVVHDQKTSKFIFNTVGGQNVFFGEWADTKATAPQNGKVFYNGPTNNIELPTKDISYTVNGVNNGQPLSGTLDFSAQQQTLKGDLMKKSITDKSLTFKIDTHIDRVSRTFKGEASAYETTRRGTGTAIAYETGALLGKGEVIGQFFNGSEASLAGVATFENPNYDIAFGGIDKIATQ